MKLIKVVTFKYCEIFRNISQMYGTMNPSCREAIENLLLLVLGNFAEL